MEGRGRAGRYGAVGLVCVALTGGGAVVASVAAHAPAAAAGPARDAAVADGAVQRLSVPTYFNPTTASSAWDAVIGAAPGSVGMVIANVADGPGSQPDPVWASTVDRAARSGITVLGYVNTGYLGTTGSRTPTGSTAVADWAAQAEKMVDAWYAMYGSAIGGIFFDQTQNGCGPASGSTAWAYTYSALSGYVKRAHPQAVTVLNAGTAVPQCYENAGDVLVTFEGSYALYSSPRYASLTWAPHDPSKIWHLVYDAPAASDMEGALALSRTRGAGYVFVTSAALPEPWAGLPAPDYLGDEMSRLGAAPTGT